jgi:hypothetical protein
VDCFNAFINREILDIEDDKEGIAIRSTKATKKKPSLNLSDSDDDFDSTATIIIEEAHNDSNSGNLSLILPLMTEPVINTTTTTTTTTSPSSSKPLHDDSDSTAIIIEEAQIDINSGNNAELSLDPLTVTTKNVDRKNQKQMLVRYDMR